MDELYESEPIEKLHCLILEEFHEYRRKRMKTGPFMYGGIDVLINGGELSKIIGSAKKRLEAENNG